MLEFTKVFTEGQRVNLCDIETTMNCKNIDVGCVNGGYFVCNFCDNIRL